MTSPLGDMAAVFAALGHPTRLKIVDFLRRQGQGGEPVGVIQAAVQVPASTLSHHLDVLKVAGVLRASRQERFIYYALEPAVLGRVAGFFKIDD